MSELIQLRVRDNNIAEIIMDQSDSRVNLLGSDMMKRLDDVIAELINTSSVKAAVIRSAKSGGFVAGADINEIEQIRDEKDGYEKSRMGQRIFRKIAELPFPVIAAVHGHCMGGGTELILACEYRLVAKDNTSIGLPEVKLGIFPGWGGTQRLPRLVSLQTALDMILTGKSYGAYRAGKVGLADMVVPDNILPDYAMKFAGEIVRSGGEKYRRARKKKRGGATNWLLEKNPLGRTLLWKQARKNIMQNTGGNYPAPLRALEVIKKGRSKSLAKGLEIEAQEFSKLLMTPEHQHLLHVYHLSERPKKHTGAADRDITPEPVRSAGVLGAGVMGGGIAQLLAYRDVPVRMKDIDSEMVSAGLKQAATVFDKAVKKHKISKLERDRKMEMISGTVDYTGLGKADVVIEAVVEKMEIKKQVLQETEKHLPRDAVFASNTSALSITELQSVASHPERVCGMHFFNPVHKMPLVEVIRGGETSDKTVATVYQLAKDLGKTPIVVQDSPGFLVNRLLGVYLNEACLLAEEGFDFEWMDSLVKQFGMPMGPFRLIDEVGIDIAADVAETLGEAFHDHVKGSQLLTTIHKSGLLGKKAGTGFYQYENGRKNDVNDGIRKFVSGHNKSDGESVLRRMIYLMINEAARCLEEAIVRTPEDVDTGMIFGTGFPPFRGGLCTYADTLGFAGVRDTLNSLADRYGDRFHPVGYLEKHSAFYA